MPSPSRAATRLSSRVIKRHCFSFVGWPGLESGPVANSRRPELARPHPTGWQLEDLRNEWLGAGTRQADAARDGGFVRNPFPSRTSRPGKPSSGCPGGLPVQRCTSAGPAPVWQWSSIRRLLSGSRAGKAGWRNEPIHHQRFISTLYKVIPSAQVGGRPGRRDSVVIPGCGGFQPV